jgi:hypothetical protein
MTVRVVYSQTLLTDTQTRTSLKLITAFEERGELLIYSKSELRIWKQKYVADSISSSKMLQASTMMNKACDMQAKELNKKIFFWKGSAAFLSTILLVVLIIK